MSQGRAFAILLVAGAFLFASASPALAATSGLKISGTVEGKLATGATATLRIHVAEPEGWQRIEVISATLELRNIPIVRVEYSPALDGFAVLGGSLVRLGTAQVLDANFFQMSGRDVTATTAADHVDVSLRLHVLQTLPEGSQFIYSVSDSLGASAQFTPTTTVPHRTGFSWSFVLTLVVAVFVFGGFLGNLVASRRLNRPKASIYDVIRQRIELERTGAVG